MAKSRASDYLIFPIWYQFRLAAHPLYAKSTLAELKHLRRAAAWWIQALDNGIADREAQIAAQGSK